MTKKQKWTVALIIAVVALIAFLWYFFSAKKKTETCPDGSPIPANGDCTVNPATGEVKPLVEVKPDMNGCISPSKYTPYSYPLALGMRGDAVKQLQVVVGVKADGFFGCKTEAAALKMFGTKVIDKNLFNNSIDISKVGTV